MDFEIVGEITSIEAFAAGSSIREIRRLHKFYGRANGENVKASLVFGFPMALFV